MNTATGHYAHIPNFSEEISLPSEDATRPLSIWFKDYELVSFKKVNLTGKSEAQF